MTRGANFDSAHMLALEQKLESVIQLGRANNELYGRGLVFFMVDPSTKKYVIGFMPRAQLTWKNLKLYGFPKEAAPEFGRVCDSYCLGQEIAVIGVTMENRQAQQFTAMRLSINGMLDLCNLIGPQLNVFLP